MSGQNPEAILYDINGNPLAVQSGSATPASTPAIMFGGSDGTNTRYILVDGSGRTVAVGAGVAGTPAGGVVSIQGVTSGTVVPISGTITANIGTTNGLALDTSVNGILVAQNSTTSGQTGPLIQGAVTTAAPSYTTAKTSPLSLTTAGALRIDGSATTQPISGTVTANAGSGNFAVVQATAANLNATVVGTVTANIGTTNGLALDATLTGGTQTTRITDGTNTATVKAASTAAVATDKALVVAISPNNSVAVTGTVTSNIGTTGGLALDATLAKLTIAQGTALGANTQALIGGSVTTAAPTYTTGQISPISLTTAGALRVDGSGVTQPVSGTVAATQSGTWTVQPGNTANTTPWLTTISQGGNSASVSASNALKVDGSAVTQPVSGTVTANIGTTGGLALDTSVNGILVTQGSTTSGEKGPLIQGAVTTAAPTYTTAQTSPLSLTTAGALRIDGSAVTQPVSGTVTANQGTANTLANAWSTKITDATNGPVAVKAASTAAVATDPALVVSISPNSNAVTVGPVTVSQADVTASGALGALNAAVTVALAGTTSCSMQLSAGTLVGTIVPEVSTDGGTTWVATFFDDPVTSNKVASIVFGASNTATTRTIVSAGGASNMRVRVSAYTSGTATCAVRGSTQVDPSTLYDGAINAATEPPTVAQIGGWDGSALRAASVKAGSTAVVAADQALVVGVSPNTAVNIAPDVTATGALGALAATVQISTSGLQSVGIQIATGTLAGTIVPEFSWDGGTTWSAGYFIGPASLGVLNSIVSTNPNPAAGKMIAAIGGVGLVRVRVSAYTSGTCNVTLRAAQFTTDFAGLAGTQTGSAVPPLTLQVGGSDGTDLRALSTDINGRLNINETDQLATSSYPDPSSIINGTATPIIDAFGNIEVRGPVLTDEGSFRDDFTGAGLTTALTGTVTFNNASTSVTGAGTAFTTQVISGQWIKKTADVEANYVQVATVISDTALTLTSNYAGTTAATTGVISNWKTVTATGGTITVATSSISLTSGTTNGQISSIQRLGDFLPYTFQINMSVSQRIANQTIIVGFMDTFSATPIKQATIQFSGTTNTTLNFVTSFGSAAADTQTTAVTIPNGGTSATSHTYKIDLSGTQACLSIDGILVATNATHIPGPYDNINIFAGTLNTGTAGSSTTLAIDFVYFLNTDRLQVDNDFRGEPLPVTGKLEPVYGTNNQAMTITLASLTTGSARASTAVNNTTNLYEDVLIFVKITTAAAATSTTGYVNVYGYGSVDGGTTYPEAITGTDAGVTLTTPPNLVILAQINANTNGATKTFGPFSFCRQYGVDRLPTNWGVVVVNQTGATLNATAGNHAVLYQGVNGQLV